MPYTVTYTETASLNHIIGGQREVSFYKTSGSATQDLNADLTEANGNALLLEIVSGDMGGTNPCPVPFTFMMEQDSSINDAIDFGIGFFGTDSEQTVATEESSFGSLKALFR